MNFIQFPFGPQQFADALLEMEAEKSIWSSKERALLEASEKLKIQNNLMQKLSENLLEVLYTRDFSYFFHLMLLSLYIDLQALYLRAIYIFYCNPDACDRQSMI